MKKNHGLVQDEISKLDPFMHSAGTGTLGRLVDVLSAEGNLVNAFSIDSTMVPLDGKQEGIMKAAVNSKIGFQKFNPSAPSHNDIVNERFDWINGKYDLHSSVFGETWASSVVSHIYTHNTLSTL